MMIKKSIWFLLMGVLLLGCSSANEHFNFKYKKGLVSIDFPGEEGDLRHLPDIVYLGGGIHARKPMYVVYRDEVMYGMSILAIPKNWKSKKDKARALQKQQKKVIDSGDFRDIKAVTIAGFESWIKEGDFKGSNAYLLSIKGRRHLANFVMASKHRLSLADFERFIETINVQSDEF